MECTGQNQGRQEETHHPTHNLVGQQLAEECSIQMYVW